jgi:hypothetical protein
MPLYALSCGVDRLSRRLSHIMPVNVKKVKTDDLHTTNPPTVGAKRCGSRAGVH